MQLPDDHTEFLSVLSRYEKGEASQSEKEFVERYFDYLQTRPGGLRSFPAEERDRIEKTIFSRLQNSIRSSKPSVHRVHFIRRYRWAAAAVFIFAIATTYFLINSKKETSSAIAYKDVAPGREGAKLKLSNGRVILTDTLKDGMIAMDGDVKVLKQNGKIIYQGTTNEVVYNEIFADKGRQSSAILPDGSTVWLNAGSSLRYPLHFTGSERLVTMTGEAYFEVKHDKKNPFRVKLPDGTQAEDIGTSFNINAYGDESSIKTTLLEGSIQINGKILQPGEQYDKGKVTRVNTDNVIAWKNGFFSFEKADIKTLMRQLTRWYDIDVSFEGPITSREFNGAIGRNLTLRELLDGLAFTSVNYRIEGKKVIIVQ